MDTNNITTFLQQNKKLIAETLPTFDSQSTSQEELLSKLQTAVWNMTQNDPMMKRLGEQQFYNLPLERKLTIIHNALELLSLLKKAEKIS